jgi:ectoine hydroxylase-related dioxygenase (phytanoyl-CoA dioxygenase family)
MVVVESLPGCQRQAAHCDYIPTEDLLALPPTEMPLLFLLAIEPNTTLDVWTGSHLILRPAKTKTTSVPISRTTVQLDAGDAILFRADLVHAGSAYTEANRRVHVYLDNLEHHRDPNRTWIIYKHAPASVKSLINEDEA